MTSFLMFGAFRGRPRFRAAELSYLRAPKSRNQARIVAGLTSWQYFRRSSGLSSLPPSARPRRWPAVKEIRPLPVTSSSNRACVSTSRASSRRDSATAESSRSRSGARCPMCSAPSPPNPANSSAAAGRRGGPRRLAVPGRQRHDGSAGQRPGRQQLLRRDESLHDADDRGLTQPCVTYQGCDSGYPRAMRGFAYGGGLLGLGIAHAMIGAARARTPGIRRRLRRVPHCRGLP